jgi:hypothetical protein
MNSIKTEQKGTHLNTLEKYHICKISKDRRHINDANIDQPNIRRVTRSKHQIEAHTPYIKHNQPSLANIHNRKLAKQD